MISANMKYSEATPTFHQWRDSNRTIHGLNFSSKDDAMAFSNSMVAVLRLLQTTSLPPGMLFGTFLLTIFVWISFTIM